MQKGLEIYVPDLIRQILRKWYVLFIFILVTAVCANFYGYYRATASAEKELRQLESYAAAHGTTIDQLPEHMTAELADLRGELSEEEATFVEAVSKLYMYRMWASDKINRELIVGDPDNSDIEIVQTLYYANESVQSAVQVMTSAQKSYYNVLVKELSDTDMSETENEPSVPGVVQPRWIVIGAVLGIIIGIMAISFSYILSGKLRTATDLEHPFEIPVLADQNSNDYEALAKGIARLMQDKNLNTLCISAVDTDNAHTVANKLQKELQNIGLSVSQTSGTISEFVEAVSSASAVLFIEQIGRSRYLDIEKRVAACRNYGIPAVGSVVTD